MKLIIITLFIITILVSPIYSQWESCDDGVSGGFITGLYPHENAIYTCTSEGGIFISTDKGNTWVHKYIYLNFISLNSIVRDEINIYVPEFIGILHSNNNGENWEYMKTDGYASAIAINDEYIFVGTALGRLYVSDDNGKNWNVKKVLNTPLINSINIIDDNIYLATSKGVLVSTDNGNSWLEKNNGLPNSAIYSIIKHDNNIFVGTVTGLYVSSIQDDNWTLSGLENNYVTALSVKNGVLFVGTHNGLYISTDNGETWYNKGLENYSIFQINFDDEYVYIGTQQNLFRSKIENVTNIQEQNTLATHYDFNINPNPASNEIKIDFLSDIVHNFVIEIYDILGNKLFQITDVKKINIINISNLHSGTYICLVKSKDKVRSKKFRVV